MLYPSFGLVCDVGIFHALLMPKIQTNDQIQKIKKYGPIFTESTRISFIM